MIRVCTKYMCIRMCIMCVYLTAIFQRTPTLNMKSSLMAPLIAFTTPGPINKPRALDAFDELAVHSVYVRRWLGLTRDKFIDFSLLPLSTSTPQSSEHKWRLTDDNVESFSVLSYNILSDMTMNHSITPFILIPPHLRCSLLYSLS